MVYVERLFAYKCYRGGKVLHQHGYAICAVGNIYGQTECHKHSHRYNRATSCEGVDYAELMSAETWANGETAKTIFANVVIKDEQGKDEQGKEAITNRFQNRKQQFNQILTNQNQFQK